MHHGGFFQGNFDVGGFDAVWGEAEVLEIWLLDDVVGEGVEVVGHGVEFGVSDHCGF